jgi:hypothetical protein
MSDSHAERIAAQLAMLDDEQESDEDDADVEEGDA